MSTRHELTSRQSVDPDRAVAEGIRARNRETFYRSLHNLGLAAWFGGALFGVAGLNAAAAEAGDQRTAASWPSSAGPSGPRPTPSR